MRDEIQITPRSSREPLLNVPWPLLALVAALILTHIVRLIAGIPAEQFALSSDDLRQGNLAPLVTHLFVHGSWTHLLMNSAFTLAFGAPVARFLGVGWRGALAFLSFFLLCGVAAAMGYAGILSLLPVHDPAQAGWALVGASGAASGLLGAAARLIEGRGRIGSIAGPRVVGMTMVWIVINAVLGLSGLTPGAGEGPVAWQAHVLGFAAGLLLIGPAALAAKGSWRPSE